MHNHTNSGQLRKRILSALLMVVLFVSVIAVMPANVQAASKTPAKVTVKSAAATNQKIVVTWKKAANAKSYQIYAKAGAAGWKKVKTVKATGKKTQSYTIKKCKWNTKYQVKVRAVNRKKTGSFSKVKKANTGKQVTLQALMNSPAVTKELNKISKGLSGSDWTMKIEVSGNILRYVMTLKDSAIPDGVSTTDMKNGLKQVFTASEMKKEMKSLRSELEDEFGIYGIRINVRILDKTGTELLNQKY